MDLILTVVKDPQGANMRNHTKVFDKKGGSFGRAEDNTWVLPDPERVVSSRHASVVFEGNQFFLIDSSTNGTYINDDPTSMKPGGKQGLSDGDILGVGDYRLKVTMRVPEITTDLPSGLGPVDFFDEHTDQTRMSKTNAEHIQGGAASFDYLLEPGSKPNRSVDQWGYAGDQGHSDSGGGPAVDGSLQNFVTSGDLSTDGSPSDPLACLGGGDLDNEARVRWDNDDSWWRSGSENDHAPPDQQAMQVRVSPEQRSEGVASQAAQFQSTPAESGPMLEGNPFQASAAVLQTSGGTSDILDNVGPVAKQVSTPLPDKGEPPALEPTPSIPPQDARALAQALGIARINDEQASRLMPEVSAMLQESVARLIELMRARTAVKNELRVEQTMIQLQDNNPLKFSVTSQDAIAAMFGGNHAAFMSPSEAIKDSFDDLSDHQMAVLSGMRAAYEFMLRQFSPQMLERRLNVSGGIMANKNAKKWEAFEKYYETLKGDPEHSYRRLFGEEFASVYEQQLAQLKESRKID